MNQAADLLKLDTFLHVFYHHERTIPQKPFLRQPLGDTWTEYTWQEAGNQARRIAAALRDMGLQPGDHVGLLSKNCAHWIIADLAILMGGFVSVPFFPTLSAGQLQEVLLLGHVQALFVGKLDSWEEQQAGVPQDVPCIAFPPTPGNARVRNGRQWNELLTRYDPLPHPYQPRPSDLFTILYTSGTTGTPKGVMLTYECPTELLRAEYKESMFNIFGGAGERLFSFLPLNHIAERFTSEMTAIYAGGTISFAESLDTFPKNLQDTHPTLFFAVPRIWTKFQQRILERMSQSRLDLLLRLPIISGVIKKKIKHTLGLDETMTILSAAAPLPAVTQEWFSKLDIPIQEVYGMSETSGAVTCNPKSRLKAGTVGKPLPGCDIRIHPDSGEILIGAPWLMTGYYNDPVQTDEMLRDGYLYSGDKGQFDADGYLCITGRVKDTFKSAKGQFIVPAPIEWGFVKNHFVEQVAVCGRGLPQPIALVSLSELGLAAARPEVTESLRLTLQEVNAALPTYQRVQQVIVMRESWTVENGLLTPTLKLKRHVLDERYGSHYAQWAARKEPVLWE